MKIEILIAPKHKISNMDFRKFIGRFYFSDPIKQQAWRDLMGTAFLSDIYLSVWLIKVNLRIAIICNVPRFQGKLQP
jgi:hypothetical protein